MRHFVRFFIAGKKIQPNLRRYAVALEEGSAQICRDASERSTLGEILGGYLEARRERTRGDPPARAHYEVP
jgi:hypothetical protein